MASASTTFYDALQVSPDRIAHLSDDELLQLVGDLLRAQSYLSGADVGQLVANTEKLAGDEGCDCLSAAPSAPDPWLGSTATCWQLKAGKAGEPARLEGEVQKPIPRKMLSEGKRFVVIASGSTAGASGERKRRDSLIKEAASIGLPTDKIDVLGSERLTNWCNSHPAIASRLAGRPAALLRLDEWARLSAHQQPWQPSPDDLGLIASNRNELDFEHGQTLHIHIQGPPGVGKTRFALELCREARWNQLVLYARQAGDLAVGELILGAAREPGTRLVLVVDEAQFDQLASWRDCVDLGGGRIRLVTIGHSRSPDVRRIPAIQRTPLDSGRMTEIVRGWYPAFPPEHTSFVVRFADGYVRLARLAADAVVADPQIDVLHLLDQDQIRDFLRRMLGGRDYRSLLVVAALKSVGWTDELAGEGEAISAHFKLDWHSVRTEVERFDLEYGVAPRGGRLRYISPEPLALLLVAELWRALPEEMRSLPGRLPNDDARERYYDRLQTLASSPIAREFAKEELARFFRLDHFLDEASAKRWSAVALADPQMAGARLAGALLNSSIEDRRQLRRAARREILGALRRLARRKDSFGDSITALALLAEAENESWANNSTGEFLDKFDLVLSGTSVAYLDRLEILDQLSRLERPVITELVIKALSRVGRGQGIRVRAPSSIEGVPEPEWKPESKDDLLNAIRGALGRLADLARMAKPNLRDALLKAAHEVTMLLRDDLLREQVGTFFKVILASYPKSREDLRRLISDLVGRERAYWKQLNQEELEWLDQLHDSFVGHSLSDRLHQAAGTLPIDSLHPHDLTAIARELFADEQVLWSEMPWLTSGEAPGAWQLGVSLSQVDQEGRLEPGLSEFQNAGRDLRLVCGYIAHRRSVLGEEWFAEWFEQQAIRSPPNLRLIVETIWRTRPTDAAIDRLAGMLRRQKADPIVVGALEFGTWANEVSKNSLRALLDAMVAEGFRSTAVAILDRRLEAHLEEVSDWETPGIALAVEPTLVRSGQMTAFHWARVAMAFVASRPESIGAAILEQQADRRPSDMWFLQNSEAEAVLKRCIEVAPEKLWDLLATFLASPEKVYSITTGFPEGLLELMPSAKVLAWAAEDPGPRVSALARLARKDLSSDTALDAELLGRFGDIAEVSHAFISAWVSGGWVGEVSERWKSLAALLEKVVARTKLPILRRWASSAAAEFRRMAMREQLREDEWRVRNS